MKHILFTVAVITILSACQKKQCWTCTTQKKYYYTQGNDTALIYDNAVCDKTKKEIDDYAQAAYQTQHLQNTPKGDLEIITTMTCR